MEKKVDMTKKEADRLAAVEALMNDLAEQGVPEGAIKIFNGLQDGLYCSYLIGETVARRLVSDGKLGEEDEAETALLFCQMIFSKIQVAPAQSGLMRGGAAFRQACLWNISRAVLKLYEESTNGILSGSQRNRAHLFRGAGGDGGLSDRV